MRQAYRFSSRSDYQAENESPNTLADLNSLTSECGTHLRSNLCSLWVAAHVEPESGTRPACRRSPDICSPEHSWGLTPGFVADTTIAEQLAEIGGMLLVFGVGPQFHIEELLAVCRGDVPGAIAQSAIATARSADGFAKIV